MKMRKMKSLLNRLSLEKFEEIYEAIIALEITKCSELRYLTNQIFQKATTQHHFIDMYTQLCTKLDQEFQNAALEADDGTNVPGAQPKESPDASGNEGMEGTVSYADRVKSRQESTKSQSAASPFKHILLTECQNFFDENKAVAEVGDEIDDQEK
jgi:hypothetical protein